MSSNSQSPTISSSDEEPPFHMSEQPGVEVAHLSKSTKPAPQKHTPAFTQSPHLAATCRSSRSSTIASQASNTESLQHGGAANERTPLVTEPDNKHHNRKENFVNNYKSELELPPRTLSPALPNTRPPPPPEASHYQNIPPYPTPSTEDPHSIAFQGPPRPDEQHAPHRQQRQQEPSCGVRVARKVRLSCCCLAIPIVLIGLAMMIVWPAAISTYQALPSNVTVLTGLVFLNPLNTLLRGGMTVSMDASSVPDPSFLRTKAYYGPMPSQYNGSYNFHLPSTPVTPNDSSNTFYMTPYIFEMGRINGSFTLTFPPPPRDMIIVTVFVFNNYMDAKHRNIDSNTCSSGEVDAIGRWDYSYNSTGDTCGKTNSLYGPNRYFLVELVDTRDRYFENFTFYPDVHISTYGTLNISNLNTFECTPSSKSVTCDVPYESFFPETRHDNHVFISTDYVIHAYYNYNTILTLTVHEWYRGDVIGYFALLVLVIIIFVVASYVDYPKLWARLTRRPQCDCVCGRWAVIKMRRGFRFLAGEDEEQGLQDGGGRLQHEN
ncbi:uncharacterized protein LOC135350541 isoform X2 [Halichondria panicea]|uniref:uncharacterized protein LOC135350541 isoform X2 n=1 Tax=Halichondria panicea TaxID=6063 RepID=UPI00312B4B21